MVEQIKKVHIEEIEEVAEDMSGSAQFITQNVISSVVNDDISQVKDTATPIPIV